MIKSYLKGITEVANRGDDREESYYSVLSDLLNNYAESIGRKSIHITTLPKKTEAGNPDFRIWDGRQHIVGYIEAKAPPFNSPIIKEGYRGVGHLDEIETTEQIKRYLHTFPNLILTNFFEFRLYRSGELIDKAIIARPFITHKLKTAPPVENEAAFINLLSKFFSFSLPKVYDAKTLAVELAKRTRFLKDEVIAQELKNEGQGASLPLQVVSREGKGQRFIIGFYETFRKYLISGLSKEDFADLYSQTITYGLFAARTRLIPSVPPLEKGGEGGFNRKLAYDSIPQTIGILRDVFKFISLGDLPKPMEWIVDDISEVLAVTDANRILHQYFHEGKGKDPVIHFYETFLSEYDPQTREKRGVYYTPEPVVSYIVRSLHTILKENFNRAEGFASKSVTVLDPAAGTLTFLAEAAKLAGEEFTSKYGEGAKENFIKEQILKNFYAFELMMAPYAIGHLKMSFLLEELGYRLKGDDRFKLYLTNTLEMEELEQTELPGMASLSEESHLAGKIKLVPECRNRGKEQPILVILGNPPYSYHSLNVGDWISKEIRAYYHVNGKPLKEKNPKGLQDDYVKFIRFAQWKIDTAGEGVLGFITNHGYLDNPTFRGMRQSLMNSFNEIYILDLHGNSLKKEKCPDASKDENVFDIQQGVAIALFFKKRGEKKGCKVYHSDLWGLQEKKYDYLLRNHIKTTKWKRIKPKSEFYLFIPREEKLLKVYESYPKITDIFPVHSVGVLTTRDNFVIDFDKETLKRRIRMFLDKKLPDEIIRQTFNLRDKSNWKLKDAREDLRKDENWENLITKILYRPFDEQWIFCHDAVIERARKEVMQHMMQENIGLITNRQVNGEFRHALCSNIIINDCTVSLETKERSYLFPLYLYQKSNPPSPPFSKGGKGGFAGSVMMLFEPQAEYGSPDKKPNLSPAIIEQLTKDFKNTPSPEQVFYYIYAILYSNTYRIKYAEFLKIDFPRIPFTKDNKLFKKMSEYGESLVNLHLLKSSEIQPPESPLTNLSPKPALEGCNQGVLIGEGKLKGVVKFQGKGNNKADKLKYEDGKIFINKEQYFEGVSPDVWRYRIGGYQVCDKWLKDRKGRILSLEDIKHYCAIVAAIDKTIEIQDGIDKVYPKVENGEK
ncbi:MAG: N-6 DNA methylase [Nitrospinae bacterium]|nr:N-6 DNA methylase [Nitrospinota bacterium]